MPPVRSCLLTWKNFCLVLVFIIGTLSVKAQKKTPNTANLKTEAITDLQNKYADYKNIAFNIWSFAEVGYKEQKSSALLQKTLTAAGFSVQAGVAEIPTAFVAEYGKGKPVIGILAEYDALPGLSQDTVPERKPLTGKDAGHGCGHNLFGTASVAAGIEIKKLIEEGKLTGTIRLYGCPAEEGGSGKVYMVRAGLFNDVDVVIHWHPGSSNRVTYSSSLANISAKFRFYGLSAHAAASPEKGRSALDAVESMDYMVNMMREHVPSDTRIHYVITNGGKAPNVVPDFSEVYYYVRNPNRDLTRSIFDRVVKCGNGAAMGTETKLQVEITGGVYDLLVNKELAEAMQKNLQVVGGVQYTQEENDFAKKIQASFNYAPPAIEKAMSIEPLTKESDLAGSTDVADVSWTVPTVGLSAATWVPGTPAHSWQAVACDGKDIGFKGMMVAAKTMSLTAIDLFLDKSLIDRATAEFKAERGDHFEYHALLGDRKPALNYRD